MPYINKVYRKAVDSDIDKLVEDVLEISGAPASPGAINYVISRIVAKAAKPPSGWSYNSISNALRMLHDAEAEMRRRLLDPYEDKAIIKNGDIPEYESPS